MITLLGVLLLQIQHMLSLRCHTVIGFSLLAILCGALRNQNVLQYLRHFALPQLAGAANKQMMLANQFQY
jgi:hypothetical protein